MKLRVYGNHVRLRLSRGEVARLAAGESIEERTALSPLPLVYRLVPDDVDATQFSGGVLSVHASRVSLRRWAMSDDVSFSPADRAGVSVLIEKDFQCLHGDGEDQPDCFPNPLADASA